MALYSAPVDRFSDPSVWGCDRLTGHVRLVFDGSNAAAIGFAADPSAWGINGWAFAIPWMDGELREDPFIRVGDLRRRSFEDVDAYTALVVETVVTPSLDVAYTWCDFAESWGPGQKVVCGYRSDGQIYFHGGLLARPHGGREVVLVDDESLGVPWYFAVDSLRLRGGDTIAWGSAGATRTYRFPRRRGSGPR